MDQNFDLVWTLLADSGGYAVIVGLLIVLPFILSMAYLRWWMGDRSKRMDARENMERVLSQAREAQLRRDYDEQLLHERRTQEMLTGVIARYDDTQKGTNAIMGELMGLMREVKDELRHTARALDRNAAVLERFVPSMAKKRTPRKPVAIVERTVETKAITEVTNG